MTTSKKCGLALLLVLAGTYQRVHAQQPVTVVNTPSVNCTSGCSAGTTDTDDGSIAAGQTGSVSLGLSQIYDGAVWRRLTFGQAAMAASIPVVIASNQSALTTTDANLDIALSALRDAIVGAGPKTLTDVVNALTSLTVSITGSVTVTGPLTDTQLRASAVPMSLATLPALAAGSAVIGHVIVDTTSTTAVTQATAGNLNATVVGTGTFGAQVTGSVTANAGTNLNTSLLALETTQVLQATAANQTTGNSSLSTLAGTVTTDNAAASQTGVQIMGANPLTGTAQPIATTRGGAIWVQPGTVQLPGLPCNPVRRTNCQPRTF